MAEVEAQFQRSKWSMIAQQMERTGAAKYSNAFIQKKYDEMSKNGILSGSMLKDESSGSSGSDATLEEDITSGLRPLTVAGTTTGN